MATSSLFGARPKRAKPEKVGKAGGRGRKLGLIAALSSSLVLAGGFAFADTTTPSPTPSDAQVAALAEPEAAASVEPTQTQAPEPTASAVPEPEKSVEPAPAASKTPSAPATKVPDEVAKDEPDMPSTVPSTKGQLTPAGDAKTGADAIMPLATSTTMDVVVRKRVLADPSSLTSTATVATNIGTDYRYTQGAVFRLYTNAGSNANQAPGTVLPDSWATCTVGTTGECTITIPNANTTQQNGNQGKRFWVVEEAPVPGTPAANTYANAQLYVGAYTGPKDIRRLVGLTKAVGGNTTNYLPMVSNKPSDGTQIVADDLPGSATVAQGGSFGAVVNSLNNPKLAPVCVAAQAPLKVAIVLDESDSILNAQWTTLRNALVSGNDSVLGLLKTADAQVSVLGFGSTAGSGGLAGSNQNGWHFGANGPAVLPATLGSVIPTSRPTPSTFANATNWDAAMSRIADANATAKYDLVMFVTDGAPNVVFADGEQPSGFNVTLRSLEAPMYAANTIKAAGTRVVAVGVGGGASGTQVAANLRAVSGATANSDYVQGDWGKIKDLLSDIVKGATCTVPIEVSKTTVTAAGAETPFAAGWTFATAKAAGSHAAPTLSGPTPTDATTTAGETGTVKWDLKFTEKIGQPTNVTITETAKSGWTLDSVACTVAGVPRPVTISNGAVSISGVTTTSEKVACTFTNREIPPTSTLAITKAFDSSVPSGSGTTTVFSGVYTCTLNRATVASGTWSRTGTGAATLTPASGSPAANQIPAGASCSATENPPTGSTGLPNSSYEWGTASISQAVTLVSGQTGTITVTNTAKRVYGNFAVTKVVPAGSLVDAGRTFNGGWSCTLGTQTVTGTWGPIAAGATWTSTANSIPLGATCTTTETRTGEPVTDGSHVWDGDPVISGPATVVTGPTATITVTNKTKPVPGTVAWVKVAKGGQTPLNGSEWNIVGPASTTTVTPVTPVTDCVAANAAGCTGADKDPAAGKFLVKELAWGTYQLVETKAPPGYLVNTTPVSFTIGRPVGDVKLTWNLGTIENQQRQAPILPLTGGIGRDQIYLAGAAALLLAMAAYGTKRYVGRRHPRSA